MLASLNHSLTAVRVAPSSLSLRALVGLLSLARSRRQLRDLDDRSLSDIGVTRAEAEAESARPAWDVPQTWRL